MKTTRNISIDVEVLENVTKKTEPKGFSALVEKLLKLWLKGKK
jgi:predicted CopG family antitoxin